MGVGGGGEGGLTRYEATTTTTTTRLREVRQTEPIESQSMVGLGDNVGGEQHEDNDMMMKI